MTEYKLINSNGTAEPCIQCMTCKMISYNSNDIEQKYCGFCHKFHESIHTQRGIDNDQ